MQCRQLGLWGALPCREMNKCILCMKNHFDADHDMCIFCLLRLFAKGAAYICVILYTTAMLIIKYRMYMYIAAVSYDLLIFKVTDS